MAELSMKWGRTRSATPIWSPEMTPDAAWPTRRTSRAIRRHLRRRGIRVVIPQPADRAANRKRLGRHGGRPPRCRPQPHGEGCFSDYPWEELSPPAGLIAWRMRMPRGPAAAC